MKNVIIHKYQIAMMLEKMTASTLFKQYAINLNH